MPGTMGGLALLLLVVSHTCVPSVVVITASPCALLRWRALLLLSAVPDLRLLETVEPLCAHDFYVCFIFYPNIVDFNMLIVVVVVTTI